MNYIYIQKIILSHYKDVRYANFAQQRKAIKFLPVKDFKVENPDDEIFFNKIRLFQTPKGISNYFDNKSFNPNTNNNIKKIIDKGLFHNPFDDYLGNFALRKDGENYTVLYNVGGKYKTCFTLQNEEYGRLIYNRRTCECDTGRRIFQTIIVNFLQSDKLLAQNGYLKEKLFYQKIPDHEYKNLRQLYL